MASKEVNDVDMQDFGEDRRPVLKIQGKSFLPYHIFTSSITKNWKSHFNGQCDTWINVPKTDKDIWFQEFKDEYKWDLKIEKGVRKLFHSFGAKSLRETTTFYKETRLCKSYCLGVLWRTWRSDEFIAKSNKLKDARQANKRPHTGGSISNIEHKTRLDKELGRKVTSAELFSRTHKKKTDDSFVNDVETSQIFYGYFDLRR